MVKKLVYSFIIITGVLSFNKCVSRKERILVSKKNNLNSTICSGIYLNKDYIYDSRIEKVKSKDGNYEFKHIKTDSITLYQGYRFFSNGTLRTIESQKTIDKEFILNLLNKGVNDKSNWGVYELKNDTIIMQQFDASPGLPINETIGIITNKRLKEFKVRSLTYSIKFVKINKEYLFYPITIITDSVAEFIKPFNNTINEK